MQKKVYVAGPMTGYFEFNYKEFFKAAKMLEKKGFHVFNPAQNDIASGIIVKGTNGKLSEIPTFDLRAAMKRNCCDICDCTHMYMLLNWEYSKGARAEHTLATLLNLHIMYEASDI